MQFPPPDSNLELNKLYSEAIKSEFSNNLNILNKDIIGKQLKAILSMNQDSLTQLHSLLNICERSIHSEHFQNHNITKFVKLQDIQSQSYLIIHSSAKPHQPSGGDQPTQATQASDHNKHSPVFANSTRAAQ